jgi:hypothetical protein
MKDITSKGVGTQEGFQSSSVAKPKWEKPEITDFKPITVARGVSYRIGDGVSNLT